MKFACDSCQTKYSIPDEKVRGKVLKIRCKKCGSVITVREEAAAQPAPIPIEVEQPPEERTRVADIAMLEKLRHQNPVAQPAPAEPAETAIEWFAMIGGQQAGPFTPDDLSAKALGGQLTLRTHVWRDGMADWKRAEEVDEVKSLFPRPAPPPPAPPPPRRPPTPAPSPIRPSLLAEDGDSTMAVSRPDLVAAMKNLAPLDDEPSPLRPAANKAVGSLALDLGEISPAAESRPRNGSSAPSVNLADLVAGDLDHAAAEHASGGNPVVPDVDPFGQVPDAPNLQQPVIGEQTRFFMKKAGVTNRNPWWKYVIFVVSMIGFPVAAIYGLGQAGVGGQRVIIDANGQEQSVPTLSAKGLADVTGLGALLLGQKRGSSKPAVAANTNAGKPAHRKAPVPGVDPKETAERGGPDAGLSREQHQQIGSLYEQIDTEGHSNKAPVVPKDAQVAQVNSAALSEEQIQKVVGNNAKAFERCMDDELRHNPGAKGGKVMLHLVIKASGKVTSPAIVNRPDMNSSSLGECIKGRATHMSFPQFDGEDQEVEFPLVLANGG